MQYALTALAVAVMASSQLTTANAAITIDDFDSPPSSQSITLWSGAISGSSTASGLANVIGGARTITAIAVTPVQSFITLAVNSFPSTFIMSIDSATVLSLGGVIWNGGSSTGMSFDLSGGKLIRWDYSNNQYTTYHLMIETYLGFSHTESVAKPAGSGTIEISLAPFTANGVNLADVDGIGLLVFPGPGGSVQINRVEVDVLYYLDLVISLPGSGSISASPPPDSYYGRYEDGMVVTLTANAASGYVFDRWSGDATGSANPTTITMDGNKNVTANFSPVRCALTLVVVPSSGGNILGNVPPGPDGKYNFGTVITLTANPALGYEFSSWSGNASGTANPLILTLNNSLNVIANFIPRQSSVAQLPTNSFSIEAEHFDLNRGQALSSVHGPFPLYHYSGSEYQGFNAVAEVDYHRGDNLPNPDLFRLSEVPNVPMVVSQDPGTLDVQRPGFNVLVNHRIGYINNGDWYHYTRNVPAGLYTAWGAFSHNDAGAEVGGWLGIVTNGQGTTNPKLKPAGNFRGLAPGSWGNNALVPLLGPLGQPAIFQVPQTPVTLRVTTKKGDFDWFTLVPVGSAPPQVTAIDPPDGAQVRRDQGNITFTIEDLSTAVVPGSVQIYLDGVSQASGLLVNKKGTTTTAFCNRFGAMFEPDSWPLYTLVFRDTGVPARSYTNHTWLWASLYPTNGIFVIEAEDFNYGSGKALAVASQMPYVQSQAYLNLGGTAEVDYHSTDGNESDVYRKGENPNVNILDNLGSVNGRDRGVWEMTSNYRIGYMGAGEWWNYTRNFPANRYEVYAALSHEEQKTGQLRGSLDRVTSGATTTSQTVSRLGTFVAAGSGGWGKNVLVPLRNTQGQKVRVSLSGSQTLRFNGESGDIDYLVLAPVDPTPTLTLAANPSVSGTIATSPAPGGGRQICEQHGGDAHGQAECRVCVQQLERRGQRLSQSDRDHDEREQDGDGEFSGGALDHGPMGL